MQKSDHTCFSYTLTSARPLGGGGGGLLSPPFSGWGNNITLGAQHMLMHGKSCLIPIVVKPFSNVYSSSCTCSIEFVKCCERAITCSTSLDFCLFSSTCLMNLIKHVHTYHGGGTCDLWRHCINIVAAAILKIVSTSIPDTISINFISI